MQRIQWPDAGHKATYKRLTAVAVATAMAFGVALGYWLVSTFSVSELTGVLASMASVCILIPIGERAARAAARRQELRRSYAGMAITHHGLSLQVDRKPWIGSYPTRRLAAAAALKRGNWSVLVPAYGRWWALDAKLEEHQNSPFAIRGCAVADVVPAIA